MVDAARMGSALTRLGHAPVPVILGIEAMEKHVMVKCNFNEFVLTIYM